MNKFFADTLNWKKYFSIPRLLLLLFFIFPLFFLEEYYYYAISIFTGSINLITAEWHIVLFFILLFLVFLIPLSFRRKAKWAEKGLVAAFFISLFVEMYGIPLSVLFATKYFVDPSLPFPPALFSVNFLGVDFAFHLFMVYSSIMMIIGAILIVWGWVTLYRSIKENGLVTKGIYAYSRHPQYLGFILIVLAWLIAWPIIPTIIFSPILIYKYISVSKKEEEEVANEYPEYNAYKTRVPFFI